MESPRLLPTLTNAWKKARKEKVLSLGDPHPNGVSLSDMRRAFAESCHAPFEDSISRFPEMFRMEDNVVHYSFDKRDRRTRDERRQLRKEDIANFRERMEISSLEQGARRLSRTIWLAAYIVDCMEKSFHSSLNGELLSPNLSELGVRMRTYENDLALYSYFIFDKTKTFIQRFPKYFSLRLPEYVSLTEAGRRILDHPNEICLSKETMSILITKLRGHLKSSCSKVEPDILDYAAKQRANQKRRESEQGEWVKTDAIQLDWEGCRSPSPTSSSLSSALSSASSASGWSPRFVESHSADSAVTTADKEAIEITAGEIAELFVDNALSSMLVSKLACLVDRRLHSTGQVLTEPLLSLVARHSHMFLIFNNKEAIMLLKDVYDAMFHAKECLESGLTASVHHVPLDPRPSCFYGTAHKYDYTTEKQRCVIRPEVAHQEPLLSAPYNLFLPDTTWSIEPKQPSCWQDRPLRISSMTSSEYDHVQMILASL